MTSKKPSQQKRVHNDARGRRAETIAALFLQLKGYRILNRRFRCRAGEIDIVAKQGKTIVFVEVKARTSHDMALGSVHPHQMHRIIAAAKYWLAAQNHSMDITCRFDMVTVSAYLVPKHLTNAFQEDIRH